MTPALTLDEFTAALREAFPDAEVKSPRTHTEFGRHHHVATLAFGGYEPSATYCLNPLNADKRWDTEFKCICRAATAAELRALLAADARAYADEDAEESRALAIKAGRLEAAARLIEGGP